MCANSVVEIQSVKATLVRLAYRMDAVLDDELEKKVHAAVAKYVKKSEGRQLSDFLIQPALTAIADYPERPAPFNVLQCLLVEFEKWKTAEPVLRAAATALKTLVGLFSVERWPSSLSNKVYPALQACISLLDGRLKPPAVDGVASACFLALESNNWTHKVGAMEVLATLVKCARSTVNHTGDKGNNRTLLTDFLDLAALTAQRQAHFDPSERVKEAAFSLLSTIECPVDVDTVTSKEKEKSVSAESVAPLIFNSTSTPKSRSNDGDHDFSMQQRERSPLPLALTPLPEFSKELSEDELGNWRRREMAPGTAASVSTGSVPNTIHHSPDAFSMLGSDMQSINSAIEMDIENFLRGSILPAGAPVGCVFSGGVQDVQEEVHEEEDVYSEGWNDFFHASLSDKNNGEDNLISNNSSAIAFIDLVLGKALEEFFKEYNGVITYNLSTKEIEEILRACLDIHSEHAYERHVQRAEALLVKTSQFLQSKPDADVKLQRGVQQLENDVHRAVAEDQAQFMEFVVPEIADILANPQMLERLLVH